MNKPQRMTLAELQSLPTLTVGWTDDLKVDDRGVRIWLSRLSVHDGEEYDNKVTVEYLDKDYRWQTLLTYPAA